MFRRKELRQVALAPTTRYEGWSWEQWHLKKGGWAILREEKGGMGVLEPCSTAPGRLWVKRYYPRAFYCAFLLPGCALGLARWRRLRSVDVIARSPTLGRPPLAFVAGFVAVDFVAISATGLG